MVGTGTAGILCAVRSGMQAWCPPCLRALLSPPLDFQPCQCAFLFAEEKDSKMVLERNLAKETPAALAEDGGDSEPSDEDAAEFSAESRDTADEDTPGTEVRAQDQELLLDGDTPAVPQEPTLPEDGVDLLGLHSEAGPAPPTQASGAPPSNADLLSCLLGPPEAAPEGSPGDLLGSEAPLLFTSPAPPPIARSTPREGPTVAGTC